MSGRARAWVPAILWAATIFVFSARPTLPVDLTSGRDKIAHFAAYMLLGLLLARATTRMRWPGWTALALGLSYAASDELHQSFVPGRSADLFDWLADALGVGAGLFVFFRQPQSSPRGPRSGDTVSDSLPT